MTVTAEAATEVIEAATEVATETLDVLHDRLVAVDLLPLDAAQETTRLERMTAVTATGTTIGNHGAIPGTVLAALITGITPSIPSIKWFSNT